VGTSIDTLLTFIDAAPSPYHAVAEAAGMLEAQGFTELSLSEPWEPADQAYVAVDGTLIAWQAPPGPPWQPFRILAAHTDSPNLRVRPRPDRGVAGCRQLALEPYGGVLLNSWLDRDLGLSGRVLARAPDGGIATHLVRDDRPLLRIPQLAIHLDREITERGLLLNPQLHIHPIWGLGSSTEGEFASWLAERAGVPTEDVLGWDMMVHDTLPAGLLGTHEEFISAPRLDNLCSCVAILEALRSTPLSDEHIHLIALFDHEEVGSQSRTGAASSLLGAVIDRLIATRGGDGADRARALAASACVSVDMAHGTHPNYPDRHEPSHWVTLGGGPVIKSHAELRYATDGATAAAFRLACDRVGIPVQEYSHRADLRCGSTIGPITAARLGVATVDVGAPQLAMHSAREFMASSDVTMLCRSLGSWLAGR
jgi:aspartyl aminopeptidase